MIIPLLLWKAGAISQPNFYISAYFEKYKDEYIDRMRAVSASEAWLEWITFFLSALEAQANQNLQKAEEIKNLYQEMKQNFIDLLSSKWAINALDFVFTRPVFKNSQFTTTAQIPSANAHKITRKLAEAGILRTLHPAAGRRPAVFAFEPLLALVRS
jgi:Fic family protein